MRPRGFSWYRENHPWVGDFFLAVAINIFYGEDDLLFFIQVVGCGNESCSAATHVLVVELAGDGVVCF